jgi:1,2-diacylglycerol 3-alpha-glucosyltransferase
MKIGLFTDTYYPQINGVATSVLMLKENLELRGHKVYVFTTTDPKADSKETNVYRVPSIPFVSARRVGTFYNPRLAKFIKKLGLDIIHTHTEFSLGIFGRAMAKELNIPFLHTYHTIYEDYTHYIGNLRVFDPIAKKAVRKISINFCNSADKVIVPTEKVKDYFYPMSLNRIFLLSLLV